MEKVAPNSKFVGHSTEIIQQSKIKGPLKMLQARYSNDWDIRPCSFLNSRPLLCSVSSVSLSGEVMVFPAAPFRTVYN